MCSLSEGRSFFYAIEEQALTIQTERVGAQDNTKGVIPYLAEEPAEFEAQVERFQAEELDETAFIPWRLIRGVYGQRQSDVQMVRVKVPGGLANAEQLEALAEVAERYAPLKKGHITTRENIQFHHVKLEHAGEVMRILGETGLSTREACGNTVRNVIADPLVGVDPQQAFDVTPYMVAYVRFFLRRPLVTGLPRKFKTAFSSGEHDPALTGMHDMGFIARVREIDGVPRRGFKLTVGGGTSIQTKLAVTLSEFVPVEEYLKVTEAVLRVFDQADELRKNKMMARIKVLIHRHGEEAFKAMVEQELEKPWAQEGDFDPTPLMAYAQETPPPLSPNGHAQGGVPAYALWKKTNVLPQAQEGYFVAYAKVPRGDLTPEQFRGVAAIARAHGSGTVALGAEQNLALRWVPEGALFEVWRALDRLGLGEGEVHTITDVTSCPGTDSCKLGITSSMGLNQAITEGLKEFGDALDDPLVKKLHIKISGCPNGCGRNHLANIGFHGASMKGPNGQQIPAYEVFIGGNYDNGQVVYAHHLKGKVPAKGVPEAVRRMVELYRERRTEGEEFNDFVQRVGTGAFEELLATFREVEPLGKESLPIYIDWGKTIIYKLERGEGECAV